MHKLLVKKVFLDNIKDFFKGNFLFLGGLIGLGILVAILGSILGLIGFIVFPLGLFGLWFFLWENLCLVFRSIKRLLFWTANPIYYSWKRYGKNNQNLDRVESILMRRENDNDFFLRDDKLLLNIETEEFVEFKDILEVEFNLEVWGAVGDMILNRLTCRLKTNHKKPIKFNLNLIEPSMGGLNSTRKSLITYVKILKKHNKKIKIFISDDLSDLLGLEK